MFMYSRENIQVMVKCVLGAKSEKNMWEKTEKQRNYCRAWWGCALRERILPKMLCRVKHTMLETRKQFNHNYTTAFCMWGPFLKASVLSVSLLLVPGWGVDPEHQRLWLPNDHGCDAVHRLHFQPLCHQHWQVSSHLRRWTDVAQCKTGKLWA